MRKKKTEIYKNEQDRIIKEILKLIGITYCNKRINRDELLKEEIICKIENMEDEIKKYYSVSRFRAYKEGKDKYLNLIKNLCKEKGIEILKLQGKRYINNEDKKRETYVIYQFEIPEYLKDNN